jgi:hypothetical protein
MKSLICSSAILLVLLFVPYQSEAVGSSLREVRSEVGLLAQADKCKIELNLALTVQAFISKCVKGSVREEFPSALLGRTVGDISDTAVCRFMRDNNSSEQTSYVDDQNRLNPLL